MSVPDIDDTFADMYRAPPPGRGGNYINEDGVFKVELTKVFGKSGFKGKSFIAEFKILESNVDSIKVDSTKSWTVKFDNAMNLSDMKAFMLAVAGLPATTTDPEANKQATYLAYAAAGPLVAGDGANKARKLLGEGFSEDMFAGIQLRLETRTRPNTTKPGNFTIHAWAPADPT